MRRLLSTLVLLFACCQLAQAQWTTKVEEDVLTDGKSAVMAGLISLSQAIYLDCSSSGKLSLSYIEKSAWDDVLNNAPAKMAIKVGDGEKVWLDVVAYRHNDLFIGFKNDADSEQIVKVVKAIRDGKGKPLYGVKADLGDASFSGSATLNGSTQATKKFVQACNLSLDAPASN